MSDTPPSTPDQAPQLATELPSDGLEEFLEKHGKKLAVIVIAALAAAGIYFFLKSKKESARIERDQAFVSAATSKDLEAVAKQYEGTVAGGNALLALADRQLAGDKASEAKATLESFLSKNADHPLHGNGLFALGCVEEKLGNAEAALAAFNKVAATDSVAAAPAALRAADVLLAKGELEKAKDAYDGLGKKFPASPFITSALQRVVIADQKLILRDNPAPAPEKEPEPETKAPPAPPTEPAPTIPTPTETPAPTETPKPAPAAPVDVADPAPVTEEAVVPSDDPAPITEEAVVPGDDPAPITEEAVVPAPE